MDTGFNLEGGAHICGMTELIMTQIPIFVDPDQTVIS